MLSLLRAASEARTLELMSSDESEAPASGPTDASVVAATATALAEWIGAGSARAQPLRFGRGLGLFSDDTSTATERCWALGRRMEGR